MSGRRIEALQALARMALDAELVALRTAREAQGLTEARLDALRVAAARQAAVAAQELEVPVAGPVLARWGAWAEVRRIDLNARLARERAEAEARRQEALDAFGRTEALRLAARRAAEAGRLAARRRAGRGGPEG